MRTKFPNLFTPVKLDKAGIILKNRFEITPSTPVFIQGPESYPSERMIRYYANLAKNGAAIITTHLCKADGKPVKPTTENHVISGHIMGFDIFDTKCSHYITQLAEAVHFYNSRLICSFAVPTPEGYDVSNVLSAYIPRNKTQLHMNKEMTKEMLYEAVDQAVKVCKKLKDCGIDGVYIHACYRGRLVGRFLSKATNKRIDEFGGSLENRCRFPFYLCDEIKKACGKDFIIEMSISGEDNTEEGKWTLEDTKEFMKLAEGHVDIVQLRSWEIEHAHPIGYELNPRPFTYMAEAAKKSGSSVLVTTVGGNFDPNASEKIIAEGKADLIGMARGWISNPEYGKLLLEGKENEIVPCIRCNKCLLASNDSTFASVCSVNPRYCLVNRLDYLVPDNTRKKKVAVIGGGPAGMETAIIAYERGHEVTLFEKQDKLGGQLNIATIAPFKWPLKEYTDFLIKKAMNTGFKIELNTLATPELIKVRDFDCVVVAIGAESNVPNIKGVQSANVISVEDVYLQEEKVGQNVVIIGGGEVGVETALYLNSHEKNTTIVEMQELLMPQTSFEHYYALIEEQWEMADHMKICLKTKAIEIRENEVICEKNGIEFKLQADSVILALGYKAKIEEAYTFAGTTTQYYYIGDCKKARSLQAAIREGYSIGVSL